MADQGSMDEFLSKDIDQNKVSALVGSLESQLASTNKDSLKTVPGSTFNNNNLSGNASIVNAPITSTPSVTVRPQQTVVSVQGLGLQSQALASSKIIPQNAAIINSNSNSQIIGISSIINANSLNNRTNLISTSLSNSSVSNTLLSSATKYLNSSPSIRIVTNNSKTQNSILHNSPVQVSKQPFLNSAISQQSVSTIRQQPVSTVTAKVNISSSGASTAMHNLATIAAEQKPLTVLPNGSTHLQNVQTKDGSVITQQIIMKNDANHTVVKRELNPLVKSDISMSNSVIQGLPQNLRQSTPIITTGTPQIVKGISASSNPALVTLRTPHSQQHVVVRATVATTLANSSPSVQVVNASAASTPSTLRPNVAPQMRPVRITNQVRIGTPPNIAPRHQNPQQGTITIPHGTLLVRNESGQYVLVSAAQTVLQQTPSSNSVITTIAPTGYRIQNVRPLTSQAPIRGTNNGQSVVTLQPQTPTQQSIQVRTLSSSTVPTATLQQRPTPQQTTVIGQSSVANLASQTATGEMNKGMLENVKKCKNFLSTLIKLASNQPDQTVKNVKAIIQGLIDGKIEPEQFTERLQHELQSSPQPYLVPFLKKSLPLLRQSMIMGRMTIDGVNPPPPEAVSFGQIMTVSQPVSTSTATQQVITATGTLTQRPVMAPRPIITPISQPALRPTLGPASSKVTPVRQSVPQVTIAPGGNKIVVHPSPLMRPQITQQIINQVRPKVTVTGPSTVPFVRATKPLMTPTLHKTEPTSPAAGHREKRKFESLKDGDDDINDVATMGGVNLSEESKNILATTNADFIGAQMRSCKDEILLSASPLLRKITAIAQKYNIEDISPDVVKIISHATQERLRDMVSKLSVIAEHRVELYKMDTKYEVESETKHKLKFLEELDKLEKKRHEEQEREKLLRAIKSRSKNEDPEQLKLKQKAKELQLAEAEELRQREANLTALAAIGPRKKRRLDFTTSAVTESNTNSDSLNASASSTHAAILRPRIKRVNLRDVQFLLESERSTRKSDLLYKTFLK